MLGGAAPRTRVFRDFIGRMAPAGQSSPREARELGWFQGGSRVVPGWWTPLKGHVYSFSIWYVVLVHGTEFVVYFLCTLRFCFGRGQLLAHSDILWFSTVVGRHCTFGIHHEARRVHHVRHELDSAEKWESFLRDIGMDGYFCRIYGWGCSGGVLIMTATPTLPRGVYRLRPVFGLSSFVGLQFMVL